MRNNEIEQNPYRKIFHCSVLAAMNQLLRAWTNLNLPCVGSHKSSAGAAYRAVSQLTDWTNVFYVSLYTFLLGFFE